MRALGRVLRILLPEGSSLASFSMEDLANGDMVIADLRQFPHPSNRLAEVRGVFSPKPRRSVIR